MAVFSQLSKPTPSKVESSTAPKETACSAKFLPGVKHSERQSHRVHDVQSSVFLTGAEAQQSNASSDRFRAKLEALDAQKAVVDATASSNDCFFAVIAVIDPKASPSDVKCKDSVVTDCGTSTDDLPTAKPHVVDQSTSTDDLEPASPNATTKQAPKIKLPITRLTVNDARRRLHAYAPSGLEGTILQVVKAIHKVFKQREPKGPMDMFREVVLDLLDNLEAQGHGGHESIPVELLDAKLARYSSVQAVKEALVTELPWSGPPRECEKTTNFQFLFGHLPPPPPAHPKSLAADPTFQRDHCTQRPKQPTQMAANRGTGIVHQPQ